MNACKAIQPSKARNSVITAPINVCISVLPGGDGQSYQQPEADQCAARLRTIRRVSLYLTGALTLLTYLPMPALMADALAWMGLMTALIGMAAIVRLIWIDRKQTHYG